MREINQLIKQLKMQLAPLFPWFYRVLQPSFPHCLWSGNNYHKAIALTFDDGPHPEYTPQVLTVLEQYNITASFFLLRCLCQPLS